MSKITFRAADDLVERLEEFDASKSEVMREALRTYLDGAERESGGGSRLETLLAEQALQQPEPPEIHVNVSIDGATADDPDVSVERETEHAVRKTRDENAGVEPQTTRKTCSQCGEEMSSEHVHCPNCGGKASHRVFCDCGDELRSDWAFCPSCGRRTPAADVLDRP
jgi:Arc/MetJ-type ribon-helix-helix transcriptional regulator